MVNKLRFGVFEVILCVCPLAVAANFSSMRLSQQTPVSLHDFAVSAVSEGKWTDWSAWLSQQLSAELGSTMFRTESLPGGENAFDALLADDNSAPADQRATVLALVEIAMEAVNYRVDLEDALIGRYFGLMSADPASLARAIKFFGGLFETAKTNGDRKPALALGRKIILLAAKADDLSAMEKYSAECRKLLE